VLAPAVVVLVVSALTAAPAAADPIGQVLVDGHALNGPGLQASDVALPPRHCRPTNCRPRASEQRAGAGTLATTGGRPK